MKIPKNYEPPTFNHNLIRRMADEMFRNYTSTTKQIGAFRRRLGRESVWPIVITNSGLCLNHHSQLFSAWTMQPYQPWHQIYLGPESKWQRPYALAHALIRLRMEQAALAAGKLQVPDANQERILQLCGVTRKQPATTKHREGAHELAKLMFNLPLDMVADYQLRSEFPGLIPAQSYTAQNREYFRVIKLSYACLPEEAALPLMLKATTAFAAANARFWDDLFTETKLADNYARIPGHELGEKVYARIQQHLQHATPGDEFQLIDDLCALVGLPDIYEWRLAPPDGPKHPNGSVDIT